MGIGLDSCVLKTRHDGIYLVQTTDLYPFFFDCMYNHRTLKDLYCINGFWKAADFAVLQTLQKGWEKMSECVSIAKFKFASAIFTPWHLFVKCLE